MTGNPHKAQDALDEKAVEAAVTFLMETRRLGTAPLSEQQRLANDQVMRDAYRDILMKGIAAYESAKPALPAPVAELLAQAATITPGKNYENVAAMCDLIDDLATALESLSRQLNEAEAKGEWRDIASAPDEKLFWMLRILNAMGGRADASDDYRASWLTLFCDDGEPDTFNRASSAGLTSVSHDDRFDSSSVRLTAQGLAWLESRLVPADARRASLPTAGEKGELPTPDSIKKAADSMREAGDKLAFTAQTSGGVAGRDEGLCDAVSAWVRARDIYVAVKRIERFEPSHVTDDAKREEIRHHAFEDAAKVAEKTYAGHGAAFKTGRARNYEHAGKVIAQAIRARAPSPDLITDAAKGDELRTDIDRLNQYNCQCDEPIIRCDHDLGCHCDLCGKPERVGPHIPLPASPKGGE